jgi:hypothetical protein
VERVHFREIGEKFSERVYSRTFQRETTGCKAEALGWPQSLSSALAQLLTQSHGQVSQCDGICSHCGHGQKIKAGFQIAVRVD